MSAWMSPAENMQPDPNYRPWLKLLNAGSKLCKSWKGHGFRFVSLEYCKPDQILSGIGSFKCGARWNAAGSAKACYTSLTKQTAVAESDAHAEYYGFSREQLRPRLLVAVEFRLSRVLDLTQGMKVGAFNLAQALGEDWRKTNDGGKESLTQAFGRAVFDAGAEALLVPSARVKAGVNLVFFPGNQLRGSVARIVDEENLKLLKP
jgi:RES domain-containing protein